MLPAGSLEVEELWHVQFLLQERDKQVPYIVASHLKILIPVGTAIIINFGRAHKNPSQSAQATVGIFNIDSQLDATITVY